MFPIQGSSGLLQGGRGAALQPAQGGAINQVPIYTAPRNSAVSRSVSNPAVAPTYSTGTATPYVSPNAVPDYNRLRQSTFNSINDAITQGGQGYKTSMQDYLDTRKQQQNQINQDAVQNELARQQGMQGVLDMVGNGIKSGGVQLANANAGTSSAGEALARAYGILGRQQASSVGNQYAQGQNRVGTEQQNLTLADATQFRHTKEAKTSTINNIVNQTRQQLASLNQSAAYASIPERVNIEAKINQVKHDALNRLSAFDSLFTTGVRGNTPQTPAQVNAAATKLLTAGTAPESAFNYTTDVPAQFQNSGQFASSLPIFVAPKKQQT